MKRRELFRIKGGEEKASAEWGADCYEGCHLCEIKSVWTLNCWTFILSSQNIIQTLRKTGDGGWGWCARVTDEGGFVRWLRSDAQRALNCIVSTISRSMTKIRKPIQTFRRIFLLQGRVIMVFLLDEKSTTAWKLLVQLRDVVFFRLFFLIRVYIECRTLLGIMFARFQFC